MQSTHNLSHYVFSDSHYCNLSAKLSCVGTNACSTNLQSVHHVEKGKIYH